MPSKDRQFLRMQGRVGGLARWNRDPAGAAEQLAAARLAFERRFANERERAEHFARLHMKAAQARKRRATRSPVENHGAE
jgi:hypothetical protein